MGKSKINPLKYFNDQKDARTKSMNKSLKRFQDENSVVTPTPGNTGQNLNAGITLGGRSESTDEEGNKIAGKKPVLDLRYVGQQMDIDGNKTFKTKDVSIGANAGPFGVKGGWNEGAGGHGEATYNQGAFQGKAGYGEKTGFTGGVSYNRGPVSVSFDYSQKQPLAKRKGGSTSKKKK